MNWESADRVFLEELNREVDRAYKRGGANLVCRPGCCSCCLGLFPINALDSERLRAGLRALRETDPPRAEAVVERARRVIEEVHGGYPGNGRTGALEDAGELLEEFLEKHSDVPCPALEPSTGCCDLYHHRPVSCRTYGPPAVFGEEHLPHCPLCFLGASPSEIEAACLEPDRDGLENAILCELAESGREECETIVAYALVERDPVVDDDRAQ